MALNPPYSVIIPVKLFVILLKSPSVTFELKTLIKVLIQWIVVTDQPFAMVEHPLFRAILSYL